MAKKSNTSDDNAKISMKIEIGEKLFNKIVKANNNDIDKVYGIFKNKFPNFEIYGNTKEKALLNYCSFKSENVCRTFGIRAI